MSGGSNNINVSKTRITCNILNPDKKSILHLFFGISSTIIDNVQNRPSQITNNNNIAKDLYFGKINTNFKLKNTSIKFKRIKEIICFFKGSRNNYIQIYELFDNDNTKNLILYFLQVCM